MNSLEYQRAYRAKNREKLLENQRAWRAKNREKNLEYGRQHYKRNRDKRLASTKAHYQRTRPARLKKSRELNLKKLYNITPEIFERMQVEQSNKCAICKNPPTKKLLAIDHCHKTGRVRQLLCNNCNAALGMAKDDVVVLQTMIEYLNAHNDNQPIEEVGTPEVLQERGLGERPQPSEPTGHPAQETGLVQSVGANAP